MSRILLCFKFGHHLNLSRSSPVNIYDTRELLSYASLWAFGATALLVVRIPYAIDLRCANSKIADHYVNAYLRSRPIILSGWLAFGSLEALSFFISRVVGTNAVWSTTA